MRTVLTPWLILLATCGLLVTSLACQPSSTQALAKDSVADADSKAKQPTLKEATELIETSETWLNVSRPLTPADLEGRIVLLDFWTYCCINCLHVIPDLHAIEEEFGEDLTVIGVHSGKFSNERDPANIRAAMIRHDIEHPVVNDPEYLIWRRFGVSAWPTFVIIDPAGDVRLKVAGEGQRGNLTRMIRQIQQEFGTNVRSDALPIALEREMAPETPLHFPTKLAYDAEEDLVYLADSGNHRIIALNRRGSVRWIAGSGEDGLRDGSFAEAQFSHPQGMALVDGLIYVADTENHSLRVLEPEQQTVRRVAGTGEQGYNRRANRAPALLTEMASPWDLDWDASNQRLVIAMAGTHQLWTLDLSSPSQTVSVLAGSGRESINDGPLPGNSLSQPSGVTVDGDTVWFVDAETSALRVHRDGELTTLIGTGLFDFGFEDGAARQALMQHCIGLDVGDDSVWIADSYNHAIRAFDRAEMALSTLAGSGQSGYADGHLADARFAEPNDVLKIRDDLWVADTNNHQIRIIDVANDTVETLELTFPS